MPNVVGPEPPAALMPCGTRPRSAVESEAPAVVKAVGAVENGTTKTDSSKIVRSPPEPDAAGGWSTTIRLAEVRATICDPAGNALGDVDSCPGDPVWTPLPT